MVHIVGTGTPFAINSSVASQKHKYLAIDMKHYSNDVLGMLSACRAHNLSNELLTIFPQSP